MLAKVTVKLYEVKFLISGVNEDGTIFYTEVDHYIDSDTAKALKGANDYAKTKGYNTDDYIKTQVIIKREEREIEL